MIQFPSFHLKAMRLFLMALLFTFLVSCNSDDDNADNNQNWQFTAKVDGITFTAAQAQVVSNGGLTLIQASLSNGTQMALNFYTTFQEGTYPLGELGKTDVVGVYATLNNGTYETYQSINGQLLISEIDEANGVISGTFGFTAVYEDWDTGQTTTVQITDGVITNVPIAVGP